jgi:hypothetical protein
MVEFPFVGPAKQGFAAPARKSISDTVLADMNLRQQAGV